MGDMAPITWRVGQWWRFHLLRTRFWHFGVHRCGGKLGLGAPGFILAFGPGYVVIDIG